MGVRAVTADAPAPRPLRLVTFADPNVAMGAATRLMMDHPAFARLPFGEWAHVLDGQFRRGHQAFVLGGEQVVGFFGYALVSGDDALAWALGRRQLTHDECMAGSCLLFNVWVAQDGRVHRFMFDAFRRLSLGKDAVYFKRFYPDGRMRAVRVPINATVAGHVARAQANDGWMADGFATSLAETT